MLLEIRNVIRDECARQKIDPQIIEALVEVESGGNSKVARYERQFAYLFKDLEMAKLMRVSQDTERIFQKTSWGPLQLMGGTARWLGYSSWLPDLCDPRVGILWGCMYYKRVCDKQLYLNDKLACFNSGSVRRKEDGTYVNQIYVDRALAALASIQAAEQKNSTLQ